MRSDRLVGQRQLSVKPQEGSKASKYAEAVEGRSAAVKQIPSKLLTIPVCTQERKKIAIRRRIEEHWRRIVGLNSPW
ncbi:unnamed protein product [Peronospora farinosa]|nr:unnamed protein product [Peronospora farinosa]